MKRKDFLRIMGLGSAAVMVAPIALASETPTKASTPKVVIHNTGDNGYFIPNVVKDRAVYPNLNVLTQYYDDKWGKGEEWHIMTRVRTKLDNSGYMIVRRSVKISNLETANVRKEMLDREVSEFHYDCKNIQNNEVSYTLPKLK